MSKLKTPFYPKEVTDANDARTELSATVNSDWTPDAISRETVTATARAILEQTLKNPKKVDKEE